MKEENNSSWMCHDDQHSYIKIETLQGKTLTEIHNNLCEVCGNGAVDCIIVSQWASWFCSGWVSSIQNNSRTEDQQQQWMALSSHCQNPGWWRLPQNLWTIEY